MMLTLGSLFDGIGGWLLAAQHAGIKPLWRCEIDEYPRAVSEYHFPDVDSYGDIRKVHGNKIAPVDIICAGSPCQNLSVAGNRKGLQGNESSLFYESIRILKEMRDATNGKYPRFFVWENVVGAFSSNHGNDFRAVLSEIGQTDVPMPQSGRWAAAGMVRTQTADIAWRVLDAQYWGVPQRRKRIFLVADFAGQSAGEILFEPESLRGNTQEGEREGQEIAGNARKGVDSASKIAYSFDSKASNSMKSSNPHSGCRQVEVSKTLDTTTPDPSKNQGGIAIYDISHRQDVIRPQGTGTLPCLTARAGTGGNNLPVVHSYCIAGNTIDRQPQNGGNGTGNQEELSYTLNTVDRHAVAECFPQNTYDKFLQGAPLTTLKACGGSYGGGSENLITNISPSIGKVRRLTPTECERLQGLPDGYTDIEFNGKPAPDSKRYKALGNGMAQPCADFVLKQIVKFQRVR